MNAKTRKRRQVFELRGLYCPKTIPAFFAPWR